MYRIDDIGARIAAVRRRMDMTQTAFAEALGVTPQAVSKWETGNGYPDISMFPDIARILNITMDALFGAEPLMEPEVLVEPEVPEVLEEPETPIASEASVESEAPETPGTPERRATEDLSAVFDPETTEETETTKETTAEETTTEEETAATEPSQSGIEQDYDSIPPEYNGLGLVAVWGDVVCYADRSDVEIEGPRVTWGDDSYADLRSRHVVNHGAQTIILLDREAAERLAPKRKPKRLKSGAEANQLPDDLRGIDLDLNGSTNVRIRPAKEDAEAWSWYYDSSLNPRENVAVEVRDGILHVRTLNRRWNRLRQKQDKLLIWVPAAGIESLMARVRGAGDIKCAVPSGATRVEISGAGDADLNSCEDLEVEISGAGDVDCRSATSLKARIRGAGDVDLKEIRGGDIECRISGAGDIDIDRGTAGHLQLEAMGVGEFDAPELVVETASIRILGPSEVKLGRIIGRSEEQIGLLGSLRVRRRGPQD